MLYIVSTERLVEVCYTFFFLLKLSISSYSSHKNILKYLFLTALSFRQRGGKKTAKEENPRERNSLNVCIFFAIFNKR